jgi:hypothetical protein
MSIAVVCLVPVKKVVLIHRERGDCPLKVEASCCVSGRRDRRRRSTLIKLGRNSAICHTQRSKTSALSAWQMNGNRCRKVIVMQTDKHSLFTLLSPSPQSTTAGKGKHFLSRTTSAPRRLNRTPRQETQASPLHNQTQTTTSRSSQPQSSRARTDNTREGFSERRSFRFCYCSQSNAC